MCVGMVCLVLFYKTTQNPQNTCCKVETLDLCFLIKLSLTYNLFLFLDNQAKLKNGKTCKNLTILRVAKNEIN